MQITARVTADAAVSQTNNGKTVVNFSVVINDRYKAKGADRATEIATYVECAYWINPGIAMYLTKGTIVELQGRPGARAYINKNNEAVGVLTLNVSRIKLHGGGKNPITHPVANALPVNASQLTEPLDDSPF